MFLGFFFFLYVHCFCAVSVTKYLCQPGLLDWTTVIRRIAETVRCLSVPTDDTHRFLPAARRPRASTSPIGSLPTPTNMTKLMGTHSLEAATLTAVVSTIDARRRSRDGRVSGQCRGGAQRGRTGQRAGRASLACQERCGSSRYCCHTEAGRTGFFAHCFLFLLLSTGALLDQQPAEALALYVGVIEALQHALLRAEAACVSLSQQQQRGEVGCCLLIVVAG